MFLKICSTFFTTLATVISLLLVIALLTPSAYFAWHAGQPMSMPEFQGLSYFQFLAERQEAYDELAHSYQASHPYERLLAVSRRGDWEGWLHYFLTGVRDQSREAATRVQSLQGLRERYQKLLAGRRSARRLAEAVDFLIGNPILTVRGLQAGLELADIKTAQRYVDVLERAGILHEVTKRKRNRLYRADEVFDAIQIPR